jgi:general secretion pathway protein G
MMTMAPKKTTRTARRGFSMLELTLAIAIMAILMTVASVALLPRVLRAKSTVTRSTMLTVQQSINEFRAFNNRYPATLGELVPEFLEKHPRDGWKQEFQYQVRTGGGAGGGVPYDLISAGDDGQFGTADDINIWTIDEEG